MSGDRRRHERRGRRGELVAALYLALKGYRVLARRAKTPVGEIDLVCRRGKQVIFVEVKARPTRAMGAEAILPRQIERIRRAALYFTAQNARLAGLDMRIDALLLAPGRWPRHVRNIG